MNLLTSCVRATLDADGKPAYADADYGNPQPNRPHDDALTNYNGREDGTTSDCKGEFSDEWDGSPSMADRVANFKEWYAADTPAILGQIEFTKQEDGSYVGERTPPAFKNAPATLNGGGRLHPAAPFSDRWQIVLPPHLC